MEYVYHPHGVCSMEIKFNIDGDVISNVRFTGGCNGNLKGIGLLVQGMKAEDVAEKLRGNLCGPRNTSCPDQLSKAIDAALAQMA